MSTHVQKGKGVTKHPRLSGKPCGGREKKTIGEDEEDAAGDSKESKSIFHVQWNLRRTERLVDWLENNVEDHQRLFSNLAQDAKAEKRPCITAKGVKTNFHIKIAEYVFSLDENESVRAHVEEHGGKKFVKAIENCIFR